MKNYYFLLFVLLSQFILAQEPFITTWQVQGNNLTIAVPILEDDNVPDSYTIDFGDGTILTNQSGYGVHTYSSAGTYTVTVSGEFSRIQFYGSNQEGNYFNTSKILTVQQWGSTQWTSMEYAFYSCVNLSFTATDSPDLSMVTNISNMLAYADNFNSPLNDWDVSNVTNMQAMFNGAGSFNQPLNNWDVSSVTNMDYMFSDCDAFNQPLNNWDVSNVTSMEYMFGGMNNFNQAINDWNVSSVTNMRYMFHATSSFNKPLNDWDVSSVTNMNAMFAGSVFNQPINDCEVSNVINMIGMSDAAIYFNQPLNNWDVSNVTNMMDMFAGAQAFNQPLDDWDVSHVLYMTRMFSSAYNINDEINAFNQPLNNWDVSSVINMEEMFSYAESFDQPLDDWDVSNVQTMRGMFSYSESFNQPLENWNVSNVTNMIEMFSHSESFNQPLNNWNVSSVINMTNMFSYAQSFNQPLQDWDVSNFVTIHGIFDHAGSFNQDISGWDFSNINFTSSLNTNFINDSGLDINNYDALLNRFVQLGLQNRTIHCNTLEYCDAANRSILINDLGWTISGDTLSDNCGDNTLYGTILFDENNNGCDANDIPAINFMVNSNNETFDYSTTTSNEGIYSLYLMEGSYNISIVNLPAYFITTPATTEIIFGEGANVEELNFCLTATQTIEDLNLTILPINAARPGFESDYKVIVENLGTQAVPNAAITISFDSSLQNFVASTPAAAVSGNLLTFDVENIHPLQSKEVNFTMQTFTPPTVNGGEMAVFTALITPDADDNTPEDNNFTLEQEIVNSYDPNDKTVVQGDEIFIDEAGSYLDYIIRFQNTGTASAINVSIDDELHENLDWATFRPISASHDYTVKITDGNLVEFIFNDINLPHEAADEPGSHGYIAYKIKPRQDIEIGEEMGGNAGIYFDYNLPIITNTVNTIVVENMGVRVNENNMVTIYPNPVGNELNIRGEGIEIGNVAIYNLHGAKVYEQTYASETINTSGLSSGLYILSVTSDKGTSQFKIVKQ